MIVIFSNKKYNENQAEKNIAFLNNSSDSAISLFEYHLHSGLEQLWNL